jgi:predicted nuclease with TOPRIM domain
MTNAGKILVILNLLMGIFFMGFAAIVNQTRVNTRGLLQQRDATIQKTTSDLTTANTSLKTKTEELEKLTNEMTQQEEVYKQQVAKLEADTEAIRKELQEFRDRTARDEIVANKATDNQEIRTEELEQLRKFREELIAQKDVLLKENNAFRDKLQQVENDLKQTLSRNEEMVVQVADLERYINAVRQNYKIPGPEEVIGSITGDQLPAPPPEVEGIVLKVDREGKFFQISIGADDGLKPGQKLEVWRENPEPKYLGSVKVATTEAGTAVVTPIALTGGLIQPNDHVGDKIMPYQARAN